MTEGARTTCRQKYKNRGLRSLAKVDLQLFLCQQIWAAEDRARPFTASPGFQPQIREARTEEHTKEHTEEHTEEQADEDREYRSSD